MIRGTGLRTSLMVAAVAVLPVAVGAETPAIRYADQGPLWTSDLRRAFYDIDQGSQLIPFAWLQALKQPDGTPFLADSLSRYGFLPAEDPAAAHGLPIGFTDNETPQGRMVGLGCAACHVRQINVDKTSYRIDGGPSFNDFEPFARDLDNALGHVRNDAATFRAFAQAVLGPKAKDDIAMQTLRAAVDLWWVRYHTFIDRSLPKDHPWGPSRMDAISLIYNRIAGLDVGAPPTYLIPENIEVGHAPNRYPFLWNSQKQDMTQWTGFAANGNEFLALTRNLGQEYGVFGTLHPQQPSATFTIFDRNYLAENSANFEGLAAAENIAGKMGPPVWPFAVDRELATKGKEIFDRSTEAGGCTGCHGIAPGGKRSDSTTWKTPIVDVGTDRQAWKVALREADTGSMEGASVQGLVEPLRKRDKVLSMLRATVIGAIGQFRIVEPKARAEREKTDDPRTRIKDLAFDRLGFSLLRAQATLKSAIGLGPPVPPPLVPNGYEARVLQGVWAAAPYLHNGSVPSLADLLKPPAERAKVFQVGPEYDPQNVGLSSVQSAGSFTIKVTGCDDLFSGDSNCGHDYGTRLAPNEKKALLEYLKTL